MQDESFGTSLAQTTHQDAFFQKWASNALAAQTISANTWTLAVQLKEDNTAHNAFFVGSIYVWRNPSTVVGFIYDSDTPVGSEFATSATGQVLSLTGSAVTALAGDFIVFEFWRHAVQGMAIGYLGGPLFNGTTDVTAGYAGADPASYLSTPQNIVFRPVSLISYPRVARHPLLRR